MTCIRASFGCCSLRSAMSIPLGLLHDVHLFRRALTPISPVQSPHSSPADIQYTIQYIVCNTQCWGINNTFTKHVHMLELPFLLQWHWESGWPLRNTKWHCKESPSTVGTHRQYPGGHGYMTMVSPGLDLSAVAHKPAYKKEKKPFK